MYKDKLLALIHKVYRKDNWIGQLFNAAGIELDSTDSILEEINNQYFFDTALDWGLKLYEKELGITLVNTLDGRRAAVEAKLKSGGKVDIAQLQAVADSWKNGKISVSFVDGKIHIEFVDENAVPTDLHSLYNALEEIKPAHLAVVYLFKYLLIKDIHEVMTISEVQNTTLIQFAGGELT